MRGIDGDREDVEGRVQRRGGDEARRPAVLDLGDEQQPVGQRPPERLLGREGAVRRKRDADRPEQMVGAGFERAERGRVVVPAVPQPKSARGAQPS
ncbi:hypothetical protein GCM10008170_31260 [Methylopila capsulata]|uniref:Uncharacterized protein n=1 Tax=Methylopila capsulata TaxID=61654 RepID=A0A9W6IV33_9HYPH|nr:hypothetical protein GCM10008170_31260 [Methylopila capsulata]